MKIAVISDIHGNYQALKAVLREINTLGCDHIICLGDVATIGPQPREVLDTLRALDARFVKGNHDAVLLHPAMKKEYAIAPVLSADIDWCAERLTPEDFSFLESFDDCQRLPLREGEAMLGYHGSPRSIVENIYPEEAGRELRDLFASFPERLLAGGHTHIQMLRNLDGRWLINPGSVGQPFVHPPVQGKPPRLLKHAEWAMVTIRNKNLSVELNRTNYDISRYCKIIEKSSLPVKKWLLEQYT